MSKNIFICYLLLILSFSVLIKSEEELKTEINVEALENSTDSIEGEKKKSELDSDLLDGLVDYPVPVPEETLPNAEAEIIKENDVGPSEEFIKDWENVMGEFVPEDITTFFLEGKNIEVFVEKVSFENTNESIFFKGAFFLHNHIDSDFMFEVLDPNDRILYSVIDKKEGVFHVNCTLEGEYKLRFFTQRSEETKVTLAYHYFHELKKVVKLDDAQAFKSKVNQSISGIRNLLSESRFGEIHKDSHMELVIKGYTRMFWFTFLETVVILSVTILQIHFIERLLNQKITV